MSRSGEFEWISRYFAPLAGEGSFGLLDDASKLAIPEEYELVITQDAILEGIHFLSDDPVDTVAKKALRVNISDCVAKGAVPIAYSLALGVPDDWTDGEVERFAKGLAGDQETYGIFLTGGDTYRSPERLAVSVTLFGAVPVGKYVSRLGASVGDILVVSGTIGDAALGLKVAENTLAVSDAHGAALETAYRFPNPPVSLAPLIAEYATASMDISDGLLGDCQKLCNASGVAAVIERTDIPLSSAAQAAIESDDEYWNSVLAGGDDYQCLCAVKLHQIERFIECAADEGTSLTAIGSIIEGEAGEVSLVNDGAPLLGSFGSFTHF